MSTDTVTIVTQTRAAAGKDVAFAAWQETVGQAAASHAGFLDQKVIPPSPPAQVDWVILQRFSSLQAAQQWMHSDTRSNLLADAQALLAGHDDIHIIRDASSGVLPAPASAVISTRVKPGQEAAYHQWERRMAMAQAQAPGFQGYRIEPPLPGVQDSWLAIVRFDSDASLDQWMQSPARLNLLEEGKNLSDDVRARIVRTGFDQWFPGGGTADTTAPPAWKQNMIVLLLLYPVVFLFGYGVQGPLLDRGLHLPFWLSLFVSNVVGVLLLNTLVPWACTRFDWWLKPAAGSAHTTHVRGAALILSLYALSLLVFSQLQ